MLAACPAPYEPGRDGSGEPPRRGEPWPHPARCNRIPGARLASGAATEASQPQAAELVGQQIVPGHAAGLTEILRVRPGSDSSVNGYSPIPSGLAEFGPDGRQERRQLIHHGRAQARQFQAEILMRHNVAQPRSTSPVHVRVARQQLGRRKRRHPARSQTPARPRPHSGYPPAARACRAASPYPHRLAVGRGAHRRVQGAALHQVRGRVQQVGQVRPQRGETDQRHLGGRIELGHQVHVAVSARVAARHRAEHPQPNEAALLQRLRLGPQRPEDGCEIGCPGLPRPGTARPGCRPVPAWFHRARPRRPSAGHGWLAASAPRGTRARIGMSASRYPRACSP